MYSINRKSNNKFSKVAKQKGYKFIMSDESINCYGFRVLTDGIDLSAFEKNPVAFWNHRSDDRWKEGQDMPVGKWTSFEKVNGQLIGWLEIDDSDDIGKRLKAKIEGGFVCAVSIHFDPIELSESPEYLLAGQTRPTLTKSLLLECSPVGLPANMNAVKLNMKGGGSIQLNSNTTAIELDSVLPQIKSINNVNMKKEIKTMLGLAENATEEQVETAIKELQNKAEKVAEVKTEATTPSALSSADSEELKKLKAERISSLVNGAKDAKKISEAEVETWTTLATENFDSAKKALDAMTPKEKLSNLLSRGASAQSSGAESTATKVEECEFYKLSKSNPKQLEKIQSEDEAHFNKIKDEYLMLLKSN